jgi:Mitochondrial inner membrane protein
MMRQCWNLRALYAITLRMSDQSTLSATAVMPASKSRLKRWLLLGTFVFVAGGGASLWVLSHWEGARTLVLGERSAPVEKVQKSPAQPIAFPAPAIPDPSLSLPLAGESVSALEERMTAIGNDATAASGNAQHAEGLMLAFAARRAIERGQSLGYLEPALRQHFAAQQPAAVAAILAAARQPVTLDWLRSELNRLEPLLSGGDPNEGFMARASRTLSTLIVFRKADTPSERAGDRLGRAQRALNAGNLTGAIAEVGALPGAEIAANWQAKARQFVQTQKALDLLEASSVSVGNATPQPATAPVSGQKPPQ